MKVGLQSRSLVPGTGPQIPVLTVQAPQPGPVAVITANLHGDECTGIGVVHLLYERLPELLIAGEVHMYPSLNPLGLVENQRRIPQEPLDPNRAFPGAQRGGLAQRHALRIWSDLTGRRPSFAIDLHTDTGGALPYAIVDRVVRGTDRGGLHLRCLSMAEATGLTVLREYPVERYLKFDLDRSLPGALVNVLGLPAITIECGPRRRVERGAVALAGSAVLGVLHRMGMVGGSAPPPSGRVEGGPWRRESGPRSTRSGLLISLREPGDRFGTGEALAEVRGLDGAVRERLRAAQPGFVVAVPELTHAPAQTSCATIAVLDEEGP
jgi:predicted deacylase